MKGTNTQSRLFPRRWLGAGVAGLLLLLLTTSTAVASVHRTASSSYEHHHRRRRRDLAAVRTPPSPSLIGRSRRHPATTASVIEDASTKNDSRLEKTASVVLQQDLVNYPRPVRGGASKHGQKPQTNPAIPANLKMYFISGLVLAFNSGYLNGCCLGGYVSETRKQAVAAVTGAYTTSALAMASGSFGTLCNQLLVLLSYISGSAIAGAVVPDPKPFQHLPHKDTDVALLLAACLLLGASALEAKNGDGSGCIAVFCLAAAANGLQNSLTSSHTSNLIRTTHYSGISSDIGTFLGQALRGNKQNFWKLKIFAALAASFWSGGFIAYYATFFFPASTLLVLSALLYTIMGCGVLTWSNKEQPPVAAAAAAA